MTLICYSNIAKNERQGVMHLKYVAPNLLA
jgi:hypothetical protein